MANVKGDLDVFEQGLEAIPTLVEGDNILIAESCTHNALHEDIARVKIPRLLQNKVGASLNFEWSSGRTFPEDLSKYKLIIQCGGCMHTPRQIQFRIDLALKQNIPITNFGVILAYLTGATWDKLHS